MVEVIYVGKKCQEETENQVSSMQLVERDGSKNNLTVEQMLAMLETGEEFHIRQANRIELLKFEQAYIDFVRMITNTEKTK